MNRLNKARKVNKKNIALEVVLKLRKKILVNDTILLFRIVY